MDGQHTAFQNAARGYLKPRHGTYGPSYAPEADDLQMLWDGKCTACSSAMEGLSDGGEPTREGRGGGRSIGAPEVAHERRSCQATLFTVTSIVVDDGDCASDYKGQTAQLTNGNSLNFISAQCGGQTCTVDPPAEIPCPNAETQASMLCAAAAREVCGLRLDQTHEGYESCWEREFDHYVDNIMEGLTVESAIMIFPDEPSDVCDVFEEDGNELLRAFMRVKSRTELPQGLILDSTVPELAPHIIISPPSDSPFEVYCPCGACDRDWPYVPPQHTDSLVVPGQQWYYSAHEEQDVPYDQTEIPMETSHQPDESSNDIDAPHVFSHSWFRQYVEEAEEERLVFYHVIPAIHRRYFKLAALAASEVAPLFRARWDSDDFRVQIEKPFTWTDPAEPLLLEYAHQPNTLVIDSVNPFIAPHIVISEAPVQNPWVLDGIYAPPQNCDYGQYLTHPSHSCVGPCCLSTYSQYSLPSPAQEFLPPVGEGLGIGAEEEELSQECEDESDLGSDSDSSSDALLTPQDDAFLDTPPMLCKGVHEASPEPQSFYIDDDDDDLPPFDDWYQSIAQRAT